MKKRFLLPVLALFCVLFALSLAAGCKSGKDSEDFKFAEIKSAGKVAGYSLSAVTAKEDRIVIPQSYKNLPVISIGELVFKGYKSYTSITIPDSITQIGGYAFSDCTAEIIWGDNPAIEKIGENSFSEYSGTVLTIPDSVTDIGGYAFWGCTAEIIWGDNPAIEKIGENAFRGYKGTSISLPDGVTAIGEYALFGCSRLKEIVIPENVSFIGKGVLGGNNLTSVTFKNTQGWKVFKNGETATAQSVDVSNPLQNAKQLFSAYYNCLKRV